MTWPYEDRHHIFSPGHPVPSATLNEVQDKLIDLHGKKQKMLNNVYVQSSNWGFVDGIWEAYGPSPISFLIDLPVGAYLGEVRLKFYYAGGSISPSFKIDMLSYLPDFGGDGDPRIEFISGEAISGDPGWRTKVFPAVGAVENGSQLFIRVWDTATGDKVAGAVMDYYPVSY